MFIRDGVLWYGCLLHVELIAAKGRGYGTRSVELPFMPIAGMYLDGYNNPACGVPIDRIDTVTWGCSTQTFVVELAYPVPSEREGGQPTYCGAAAGTPEELLRAAWGTGWDYHDRSTDPDGMHPYRMYGRFRLI